MYAYCRESRPRKRHLAACGCSRRHGFRQLFHAVSVFVAAAVEGLLGSVGAAPERERDAQSGG